jgi:class 3 adenylate cyclase
MAGLVEPGRKRAAILFADLQSSASLSRRLPTATYFGLIGDLIAAIDGVVGNYGGGVGKHAGDGVTAFFLVDDLGSPSAAARVALESARDISVVTRDTAKASGEETGLIDADDCKVNVAVHWGGTLYMGQLVTGGRLEITALGDEVNECARIQESARDGEILVSKAVVEHLGGDDAAALGIDPDSVLYRTVSELPGASVRRGRTPAPFRSPPSDRPRCPIGVGRVRPPRPSRGARRRGLIGRGLLLRRMPALPAPLNGGMRLRAPAPGRTVVPALHEAMCSSHHRRADSPVKRGTEKGTRGGESRPSVAPLR